MVDASGGFTLTQDLVPLLEEAVFVLCGLGHLPDEMEEGRRHWALGALGLGAALSLRFSVKLQSFDRRWLLHRRADTCKRTTLLQELFVLRDGFAGGVKSGAVLPAAERQRAAERRRSEAGSSEWRRNTCFGLHVLLVFSF